jgi:hypothetical protein
MCTSVIFVIRRDRHASRLDDLTEAHLMRSELMKKQRGQNSGVPEW